LTALLSGVNLLNRLRFFWGNNGREERGMAVVIDEVVAAFISSGKCWLLAVAVGAEEADILDPIISIIAIDVIQNEDQRLIPPYGRRITLITAVNQDAFANEPLLELRRGSHRRIGDKNFGEWSFGCPGMCPPLEVSLACEMRCVQSEAGEVGMHTLVIGPGWRKAEECQHAGDGETRAHGFDDLCIRVTSGPRHDD
jgi:hypothetical protein